MPDPAWDHGVASSDDVTVAVHELHGAAAPALLVSHATGFHGRCYAPLAAELGDSFHSVAFDMRGHGDTVAPAGAPVTWDRFGDDVAAVSAAVAAALGGPIVGFGHSMGGGCALIAAMRFPERFSHLVLYEPIVPPPGTFGPPGSDNPMAAAARRRRATFASYDAALANYASKPPLNRWRADALWSYVRNGFRPDGDGVTLKCTPDYEAATFSTAASDLFEHLPSIETPVTILSGRLDGTPPPAFAEPIAQRLPDAHFVRLDDLDHFGPMTHPDTVAREILRALAR